MNTITKMITSRADESGFFGKLGRYFASPQVRKECGGYPLNDGPDYRWLVAMNKRDLRVIAFLCFEHKPDEIIIHNGYVEPDWRSKGVFKELLRQCLSYADQHKLPVRGNLQEASASALKAQGFKSLAKRGNWVKIERKAK